MSEEKKWGFFADNVKMKVTNDLKDYPKMVKIPCSTGFKQKDKTYVNVWVDVLVNKNHEEMTQGIQKGSSIEVCGNLSISEYNGKKQWSVWADSIVDLSQPNVPQTAPMEDVPF